MHTRPRTPTRSGKTAASRRGLIFLRYFVDLPMRQPLAPCNGGKSYFPGKAQETTGNVATSPFVANRGD
ncbi:hypothetical protein DFP98_10989 [Cohnella phaseoli]|uniref:Uncharacterized protein n=1 Tax=Cohnella phaseoli TaxID=456490 RepID=A0A3D9JTU6_9BACL|nr:hypothetical protein DFP98_10989 [Cohnella phaseoli]